MGGGWLKLCSASKHESVEREGGRLEGAVASLSGRSLGLATLEEHVLVQLSVVLEYGAHGVHTGDLWNE